jgi:hypothetical protein
MVLGDLASKEPKNNNHARQRCTGRLGSAAFSKKTALARRMALWCLFFEMLLSTKCVRSETAGATCAAGSSARNSHHIFVCACRNRTSAWTPRPESTASRAEHIVGEGKVRIFLVLGHLSQDSYKGAATAGSWRGKCWRMWLIQRPIARSREGRGVGVDRKGFGAGPRKPKRPDLGVLPDHRLQGKRAHRGQKKSVARSAGASMSAFEIRPEHPPHSPFCLEVYIFALSSLEGVINKRPLWLLERNKYVGSRSACCTVAHSASARAPSRNTGASRDLLEKVHRAPQND